MKVLNLQCRHGHGFEGWFESVAAFEDQLARGLLSCPLCEDSHVMRLPSAPRLNLGAGRHEDQPDMRSVEQRVRTLWQQAVEHVLKNTEDVGAEFADEVRRIHYGEAEQRGIRGQATADDVQALRDEEIEVFSVPLPTEPKGTLQ
jgi:hypothetical protein